MTDRTRAARAPIGRALAAVAILWALVAPAFGQGDVPALVDPGLEGLRYGISVTELDGAVLVAHRADERFVPASNAKLFVTAAALASADQLAALEAGTQLVLARREAGPPDLVLLGRGDPSVGAGPDCAVRCLDRLADAVAAAGISAVGDIIGDDQWFADEPIPLGWSWDDLKFGHGTAISALAVNDNVVPLRVSPGRMAGQGVTTAWSGPGAGYFSLRNEATTASASQPRALRLERRLGQRAARLYGALPARSRSLTLDLGVDRPAHLAAWSLKQALQAKGVIVSGEVRTEHRPLQYGDEPAPVDPSDPDSPIACALPSLASPAGEVIASLPAPPVSELVTEINRESNNMYAEVLLRQMGRATGTGSSFCGLLAVRHFLDRLGIGEDATQIADGSGLSGYNRASPAAITAVLRHAAAQPWAKAFKQSLPVGGIAPGTLRYRFRGTALAGKIFAKTGTLNHVDALSGFMQAASGKTLAFSIIVNDRPLETPSVSRAIDATLLAIAAAH